MSGEPRGLEERARALLARSPVFDGHNDLPWAMRLLAGYDFGKVDVAADQPGLHTDIPRLRAGGVGAQFWSVYVPSTPPGDHAVSGTLEQVDAVHAMLARYGGALALARTADEVERAWASGRIASLLGAEGGHSIDCSLGALRMLFALGVRYLTLTHNHNVPWADSATDEPAHGGLTRFGEEVVREMNRIGMLVDLSHVASATIVSPACAAWWAVARERLAAQGIREDDFAAGRLALAAIEADLPRPEATVAQVADHVEHVREVAGVDHVGLGGDYDGVDRQPAGLEDVSGYPRLIAELLHRGWSEAELAKLASGNALGVLRDAEAVARELSAARPPSLATIAELDGA